MHAASRNVSRLQLDAQAAAMSDNDSAQRLNITRDFVQDRFQSIENSRLDKFKNHPGQTPTSIEM